jgi:hypothetical protein
MANNNSDNRSRPRAANNNQGKYRPQTNGNRQQGSGGQSQWRSRFEHYNNLAQQADDHVEREHHWQHAEHYCRLLNGSAD